MKNRPCGNPKCSTSTGIHEGLTFGSGELDDYGFWERPCSICARDWDKQRPKLKRELLFTTQVAEGMSEEEAKEFIQEKYEWLFIQGWPFAERSSYLSV